jgi:hypothetical protein
MLETTNTGIAVAIKNKFSVDMGSKLLIFEGERFN